MPQVLEGRQLSEAQCASIGSLPDAVQPLVERSREVGSQVATARDTTCTWAFLWAQNDYVSSQQRGQRAYVSSTHGHAFLYYVISDANPTRTCLHLPSRQACMKLAHEANSASGRSSKTNNAPPRCGALCDCLAKLLLPNQSSSQMVRVRRDKTITMDKPCFASIPARPITTASLSLTVASTVLTRVSCREGRPGPDGPCPSPRSVRCCCCCCWTGRINKPFRKGGT